MRFIVPLIAATASLSERPGARLKDSVAATNMPWWLTASGVLAGANWLNPESGPRVGREGPPAEPVDDPPRPVEAIALVRWLRTASALLAVCAAAFPAGLAAVVPAMALVPCPPPI